MCEMVAILGFVLGLLSYRTADFFPFALVAAALLYAHRLESWPLDADRATGGAAMRVRLRFFASLRERLQHAARRSEPSGRRHRRGSVDLLCSERPELRELTPSVSFAVNREYVERAAGWRTATRWR